MSAYGVAKETKKHLFAVSRTMNVTAVIKKTILKWLVHKKKKKIKLTTFINHQFLQFTQSVKKANYNYR